MIQHSQESEQAGPDRGLSADLRTYFGVWHTRQRAALGVVATLCGRVDALARAHPEWAGYDLRSHLLAGWWLVVDNDRLLGGRSRGQIEAELESLAAAECPADSPDRHRQIAQSIMEVLTNDRDRHTEFRDMCLHVGADGAIGHAPMSFPVVRYVRADGEEAEPLLRPSSTATNVFQALYAFDPADRAAAERFRSERMLERRDYQEVEASVVRRATSVTEQHAAVDRLLARMRSNVAQISYGRQAAPVIEESLEMIAEQAQAEDRFAQAVSEHATHDAPDIARLETISMLLNALIVSLHGLYARLADVKPTFEREQDRQLFTAHAVTVSPEADLFAPLMNMPAGAACEVLEPLLVTLLGPRVPQVTNLLTLMRRTGVGPRRQGARVRVDPFDFGAPVDRPPQIDPQVLAAVEGILARIDAATSLSQIFGHVGEPGWGEGLDERQQGQVRWVLSIVAANGFGDATEGWAALYRLAVCRTGAMMRVGENWGDDLLLLPLVGVGP